MNEQIEEMVAKSGEKVLEYLEAGEGFVAEQAPLLAQEIIRYGVWWNGIAIGVCAFAWLLIFLTPFAAHKAIKVLGGTGDDLVGGTIVSTVIALIIPGIPTAFIGFEAMGNFVKATAAPRLYLLEQIAGLMS